MFWSNKETEGKHGPSKQYSPGSILVGLDRREGGRGQSVCPPDSVRGYEQDGSDNRGLVLLLGGSSTRGNHSHETR